MRIDYKKVLKDLREKRTKLDKIITQLEILGPEIHLLIPPDSLIKKAEKITGYTSHD